MSTRLPPLVIQGHSVRDYAYLWINGGCPLHQWCSGARGIDQGVIDYAYTVFRGMFEDVQCATRFNLLEVMNDLNGLQQLIKYLEDNAGHAAEPYIPDEHLSREQRRPHAS